MKKLFLFMISIICASSLVASLRVTSRLSIWPHRSSIIPAFVSVSSKIRSRTRAAINFKRLQKHLNSSQKSIADKAQDRAIGFIKCSSNLTLLWQYIERKENTKEARDEIVGWLNLVIQHSPSKKAKKFAGNLLLNSPVNNKFNVAPKIGAMPPESPAWSSWIEEASASRQAKRSTELPQSERKDEGKGESHATPAKKTVTLPKFISRDLSNYITGYERIAGTNGGLHKVIMDEIEQLRLDEVKVLIEYLINKKATHTCNLISKEFLDLSPFDLINKYDPIIKSPLIEDLLNRKLLHPTEDEKASGAICDVNLLIDLFTATKPGVRELLKKIKKTIEKRT